MKDKPEYVVIRRGRVWTGVAGGMVATRDILIKGDRIEALYEPGHEPELPPDVEEIDAQGKTIVPGLINVHTHISLDGSADPVTAALKDGSYICLIKAVGFAKEYLEAGVTTIRDLGGFEGIDLALKKAISQGIIKGPRMLVSAKILCMTGGHMSSIGVEIDGADSARRAARFQLKNGADVIKLIATGGVMTPGAEPGSAELTVDEMKAAVEEAQKAGKHSASHAQGTQGIKDSIRAGITSIEHGIYLDEEAIHMMLREEVYLVPTLSAPYFIIKDRAEVPEFIVHKTEQVMKIHSESLKRAHQAGVKIALGTDSGTPFNPHGTVLEEVRLLIQNGLSPEEALSAGTRVAADAIGLGNEIGTIEVGKLADILAVSGDPLSDCQSLANVAWVMKEAKIVYRDYKDTGSS